jgi:Kef-type K+ transport system membrane component KefB
VDNTWFLAALWVGLALVATLFAIWFRISTALSEIVVGTVAQLIIGVAIGGAGLGAHTPWVGFLAGTGAIVLTFLAGAELDPGIFRTKWKEATIVGLTGFFAPFLGSAAIAYYVLGWDLMPSWLAGVALSTTSVAVVYAVMLELGFNTTEYGKAILAACFINDLGTVIALGLIFDPFTIRTLVFVGVSIVVFGALPFITPRFFRRYGGRVSELEAKFILLALFGMGGVALWAGSEPVLPAYIIGMVLAGTVGKDHVLIRRLRTLTFGLLTPFYFIRAGSFVSVPALVAAPSAFIILFLAKMVTKMAGVFPSVWVFGHRRGADVYYTLMMSTGLTFGTISALFGLNHGIITSAQYSYLVAAVIGSAVIPTVECVVYAAPSAPHAYE